MRHIAWFDFLGHLVGQKSIKTECGRRVPYGQHVNRVAESDCVDCIHARALSVRAIETIQASHPESAIVTPERIAQCWREL